MTNRHFVLRRVVAAEIHKTTSLHYTMSLPVVLLAIFPILSVLITYYQIVPGSLEQLTTIWPGVDVSYALVGGLQGSYLLLPSLVVLSISADGSSGFTMLQTVALPTRSIHIAGKLLTLTFLTALTVSVGGATAVFSASATLHLNGLSVDTSLGESAQAVARLTLASVLIALIAAGIAYIIRNAGIALAASFSLLLVIPLLLTFMPGLNEWSAALPSTAAERLILPTYAPPTTNWHDPGRSGSLLILAAWATALVTAGWYRYCASDTQHP